MVYPALPVRNERITSKYNILKKYNVVLYDINIQ
jgi:hypothetical protein